MENKLEEARKAYSENKNQIVPPLLSLASFTSSNEATRELSKSVQIDFYKTSSYPAESFFRTVSKIVTPLKIENNE